MKGNIPNRLSEKEIKELFKDYKDGSEEAREKIINHNIRLVTYMVDKYFKTVPFDFDDLESIGISGLIKAVDNFDVDKNISFATFATRCIKNEILMFLRGEKHKKYISLDEPICTDENGNELIYGDTLSDDKYNFEEELDKQETLKIVRNFVLNMPDSMEKQAIIMYFGFNGKSYKQYEIEKILGISQSYISRILNKTIKNIGNELQKIGVVNKVGNKKHVERKITSEKKESLENDNIVKNQKLPKQENMNSESLDLPKEELVEKNIELPLDICVENKCTFIPNLDNILQNIPYQEAFIVSLKLGLLPNKKIYTTDEISNFLNMDKEDIRKIVIETLILYKQQLNNYIDGMIEKNKLKK